MGIKHVRMSRKNHPMPMMKKVGFDDQGDLSGLRGTAHREGSVLRATDSPKAPPKTRPFKDYPTTPPPKAAESSADHRDGPTSTRQAPIHRAGRSK